MSEFRTFCDGLCCFLANDSTESASEFAGRLLAMDDHSLPPLFRGRNQSELEAFLFRARAGFEQFGDHWVPVKDSPAREQPDPLSDSAEEGRPAWFNVRSGNYMYLRVAERDVVNVGLGAMARALGQETSQGGLERYRYPEEELREIMAGEAMERRRGIGRDVLAPGLVGSYRSDKGRRIAEERIGEEKEHLLDRLQTFFESWMIPGDQIDAPLEYLARAVSCGNRNPVWDDVSPYHDTDLTDEYLEPQLTFDWERGVIQDECSFAGFEVIIFRGVDRQGLELDIEFVSERGVSLIISPRFNSPFWDSEAKLEIPATFWVNGESFDVAIRKDSDS